MANIGKPEDVDKVLSMTGRASACSARSSCLWTRTAMPTEEEQFEAYKKVAVAMNGKPVIIRTLDIGGDKEIPYMGLKKDENPFLGYRAIRFCLDRREDVYRRSCAPFCAPALLATSGSWFPLLPVLRNTVRQRHWWRRLKKELDEQGNCL